MTAAWFLLGERLSLTQACGAACLVAGVALTRIGRARARAADRV